MNRKIMRKSNISKTLPKQKGEMVMKRILIVLSALICVLLPVLASCTPEKGNTGGTGNSNKPGDVIIIGDGLIFDSSVELAIVINEEKVPYSVAETVWGGVNSAKIPRIIYDTDPINTHEIVIGPTERQISKDAYKRLENIDNKSEYPGFIIYSNGSSVAIAYDDNEIARDMAIEHFISEYLTGSSLRIEAGVDFYTDILTVQEAIDKAELERYWAAVEKQLGADITRQLKAHYNIYTDNLISWYANLYEPYVCVCDGECQNTANCGGGGFYYSNSARNTPGYLPDIESTNQALGTIVSSGMSGGEPYSAVIPDWMQQQIVQFVKMRQDPNGYFYHPQWSKEDVDQHVSRRSRDLDWAGSILYNFGAMPTYNTPDGGEGDGLLWDGTPVSKERLTSRLSDTSAVTAVSLVINKAVSTSYPTFLESADTFRTYLNSLDIDNRSYHVGNELVALTGEINAREKTLLAEGKESVVDVMINYLNSHQNPDTGLWSSEINYYSVNGLFKITGCYSDTKNPIPNSDKALRAAINAITSDETPTAVVDIYNTWYTITNILYNIENYQGDEAAAVAEAAMTELRANAVSAIKATTDKLSVFRKDDGSFSYNPETTSHTSQGMAVAVPGTNEGDVNATVISTTGTTARMMKALGIDFDKKDFDMSYVPIFTKSDWIRYSAILEDLGPVIKDEEAKPKFITFEDEFLGENPVSVSYDQSASAGLSIIVDPTEGSTRGQILEIDSITGRYNSVNVLSENKAFNKACYVFEGEVCIPNSTDGYVVRLRMTDLYAFAFKVSGGKVHIWDVSTSSNDNLVETDLGIAIPLGEWFNIKVEYYRGDHDNVRMKLYINDEIAAVNDNYYDQYGKKVTNADGKGVPGSSYTYFGFSTMSGHNTKIYLDNLCCYSSNELYQPYTDIEKPLKINVDLPDRGELIYPFDDIADGANFPADFTVTGNGVSVKPATGTDKVLNILNSSTPANISVEVNKRAYRANVYIAEMTLKLNSADVGATVRLALGEGADSKSSAVIFDITVIEVGGKKYLSVADAHNDNTETAFPRIKIEQGSEAKLTVEYYKEKEVTLIYLDGNLMAASTRQSSAASRVEYKALNIAYISSGAININIDDLKAECVEKDYNGEGISIGEDRVYDFNTAENTIPGTTVVAKDGDKFTELSASSGSILIPVNDRSLLSSMTVFKAGIAFADDTNGEWTLIFENENGGAVFALVLKASGGKLWLYEKTETGKSAEPIGELDASTEIILSVEWFREYGVANIHVNNKYLTATTANYSDETAAGFINSIELSAEGGTGTLRLDDVVSENRNEADGESGDENDEIPEEGAELITFESSTSVKKLPSNIAYKLSSLGSQFKLERAIRYGVLSKVISLTSYPGGNDEINIDLTKKEKNANVAVFEADMCIDYADKAASKIIEFYLRTKGGGSNAYKFEIWQSQVLADGKLEVLAFPGDATWFKFKIEYYEGGRIIAYVNGIPVAAGDNFIGTSAILPSSIERLRIYTRGDFEGSIKLDNISFIQTTKTYVDPEIEGGGSSLGANKDVLDFEDGLVNESMQIGQGSGNGSTLEVLDDGKGNNVLVYTTGASAVVDNQLNLSFTKSESGYNAIVFEADLSLICSKPGDHNYFRLKSTSATGNKRACFIALTDKNIIVYYNGGSKTVGQLSESKMTKLRIEYGDNGSGIFLKIFVDGVCVYAEDNYVDPDSNKIKMADIDHMEISTWRTNVISKFDNVKLWKTTVDTSVKPDVVEIPGTTAGTASMDGNKYTFENGNLPSSFGYQGDDGVFRTLDTADHGKVLAFDSKTYGKSGTYNLKLTPATVSNATKAVFQTDFFLADNTDANLSSSAAFEFKFTDGSNRIVKLAMGKSGELRVYYGNNSSAVVTTFATGTWYNIKIEYYEVGEGSGLKVLIDGVEKYTSEAYDFTSNAASDKSVANVKKFDILTYGKITAYFDNIVCTQE